MKIEGTRMNYRKYKNALLLLCLTTINISHFANAGTLAITSDAATGYKDSYYFNYNGERYIAASNVYAGGGISILKDRGNNDSDYVSVMDINIADAWAPTVYIEGVDAYIIYNGFHSGMRLHAIKLNLQNYSWSNVTLNLPANTGGLPGQDNGDNKLIDATTYYFSGSWYLIAARYTSTAGRWDSHLVWSKSKSGVLGPYSSPQMLMMTGSHYGVDKHREPQLGHDLGGIVEAPQWSFWDHDGDGNRELYWSIGPSDVGAAAIQAIRRGNIIYDENDSPTVTVLDYYGGAGDIMGEDTDDYLLTHPDFTASGNIRATTKKNGEWKIVNLSIW